MQYNVKAGGRICHSNELVSANDVLARALRDYRSSSSARNKCQKSGFFIIFSQIAKLREVLQEKGLLNLPDQTAMAGREYCEVPLVVFSRAVV